MQSIHIKVTARSSIRRFALTEVKLGALRQQIVSLFEIKNDANWSIKYKDKRQLVTLASDEDLESAVKLMGNRVLHVVVVEDGVDLAENAENQERKVRRHEKRDRKCHRDERDDLVEKHREKRPVDPETRKGRLLKKRTKLEERLVSLKAAENPKAQSQASKIEQKLAAIKSEIASISTPPLPSVDTQITVAETRVVEPPAVHSTDAKILDTKMAKEVFNKFYSLNRDLKTHKNKIKSLVKVVHAMRVLSRLGEKASCPVAIDADQLALAQTSLVTMRTDLRTKKAELKQQKQLLKQLKDQGYTDKRLEKEKQRKKEKKEKKNAKKCEKKKWEEIEDKESKEHAKAQWKAEKAKKKEERASNRAENQAVKNQ